MISNGQHSSKKQSDSNYHHGDLRHALIRSTIEALSEVDPQDISLREVARRAGVSHAAPYGHFTDKRALLCAVANEGYKRLCDRLSSALDRTARIDSMLDVVAYEYLQFGIQNSKLYRLMFLSELSKTKDSSDAVFVDTEEIRTIFRRVLSFDGSGERQLSYHNHEAQCHERCPPVWAYVHGYTLFAIDGLVKSEFPIGAIKQMKLCC